MEFQEGDKVTYQFPLNPRKILIGTIEFLGESIIHLRAEEGYKVVVKWKDFDNIQKFTHSPILSYS